MNATEYITGYSAIRALADNRIQDLTPLAGRTEITFLNVRGNNISDLSAVSDLPMMEELYARTDADQL